MKACISRRNDLCHALDHAYASGFDTTRHGRGMGIHGRGLVGYLDSSLASSCWVCSCMVVANGERCALHGAC